MRKTLVCLLVLMMIIGVTSTAFAAISSVNVDQISKTVTQGDPAIFIVSVSNDNTGNARETTFSIIEDNDAISHFSFNPAKLDLSRNDTAQTNLTIETNSLLPGTYHFKVKAEAPDISGRRNAGQSASSATSAEITLTVDGASAEPDIVYESTADENFDITIIYGTTEEDAINELSGSVEITGTDGEEGTATIEWTFDHYNATSAGDYEATGVLTLPDGWSGDPGPVTAIVTVVYIEYISTVGENFNITVDYGTSEDVAIDKLKKTVGITGSNDQIGTATIAWTIADYDANTEGDYTATGILTLPDGWIGNPDPVTATVTVKEAPVVPDTIHYVALGDSLATGSTSRGTTTSYVHGFRSFLEAEYGVEVTLENLAADGDDSTDLLAWLDDETFAYKVSQAHIITLSIGGNNIMHAGRNSFSDIDEDAAEEGTGRFEEEYALIIARIRDLNPDAQIISMTLYNPYNTKPITGYEDDPRLHNITKEYVDRINDQIWDIADSDDVNYFVADVYSSFLQYANDGKMGEITYFYPHRWVKFTRDPHPNQTGQNLMRAIHEETFRALISSSQSSILMAA